jgi:hypothetical protein
LLQKVGHYVAEALDLAAAADESAARTSSPTLRSEYERLAPCRQVCGSVSNHRLDERTGMHVVEMELGNFRQLIAIENFKCLVFPAHHPAVGEPPQRLIGVHK